MKLIGAVTCFAFGAVAETGKLTFPIDDVTEPRVVDFVHGFIGKTTLEKQGDCIERRRWRDSISREDSVSPCVPAAGWKNGVTIFSYDGSGTSFVGRATNDGFIIRDAGDNCGVPIKSGIRFQGGTLPDVCIMNLDGEVFVSRYISCDGETEGNDPRAIGPNQCLMQRPVGVESDIAQKKSSYRDTINEFKRRNDVATGRPDLAPERTEAIRAIRLIAFVLGGVYAVASLRQGWPIRSLLGVSIAVLGFLLD